MLENEYENLAAEFHELQRCFDTDIVNRGPELRMRFLEFSVMVSGIVDNTTNQRKAMTSTLQASFETFGRSIKSVYDSLQWNDKNILAQEQGAKARCRSTLTDDKTIYDAVLFQI